MSTVLHRLFEGQVARTPDATAVVDDVHSLTYGALDDHANAIARVLRERGVEVDQPVGILVDRSALMVAAILGILKAGGAYLPLEAEFPAIRLREVVRDARAPVVLARPDLVDALDGAGAEVLPFTPALWASVASCPLDVDVRPDNLAAVYYTSGSTGHPKGVACLHGGWVNRMRWMQSRVDLRPGEAVLHKTTLTFDDAAVELFWPLSVGGRVVVLGAGLHRDPWAIADAVGHHRVAHVQFVPAMLRAFVDVVRDSGGADWPFLRSVLSSGEALPPNLVAACLDLFGDRVVLLNTWGLTEVSIDSTYHVCGPEDAAGGHVPIGLPMDGNEIHVLAPDGTPCAPLEHGEVHVAGIGLARGYLNDPVKTAAAFVPAPGGARLYRTGDRGYRRSDGVLVFLGRDDNQVKIRGVRIELGEVESVLRGYGVVAEAVVVARTTPSGVKRLVAHVEPRRGERPNREDVLAWLRDHLPVYAVPGEVFFVDALPRHSNGKLDRRAVEQSSSPSATS